MFRGDAAHRGAYATRGLRSYGGLLWRAPTGGPIRSTAAVTVHDVYVGSSDGHLYALDPQTGARRWAYDAGAAVTGSPAVAGDVVYVTDRRSTLHAVDARTGRARWTVKTGPDVPFPWGFESGDIYVSSPTVATGTVYFGAGDAKLYAVSEADGAVRWTLRTDGRVRSTPAVADGRVYVGSADGSVYAADAHTGRRLWRFDTQGRQLQSGNFGFDRRTVQSSPAVADGRVYIGARDGFLYAIDAATGKQLWTFDHKISWVNASPAVAMGLVFVGSSDGGFVQAVDAASGQERWRTETEDIVWSSAVVTDSTVYFTDAGGRVRALDAGTGAERWAVRLPSRIFSSPVVHDGVLYVGSGDGALYALRDGGSAPLDRAVFWDSTLARAGWYEGSTALRDWLEAHGYTALDAPGLVRWMTGHISSKQPSSVVFAQDVLPDSVGRNGAHSVMRRYLDAGGTVVWLGYPPGAWLRDPTTGVPRDIKDVARNVPGDILGLNFAIANFDRLGARPTPLGRAIGLPSQWTTRWSIAPQDDVIVLGTDENDDAASWRKTFGGPPGTGFVRLWGGRAPIPDFTPVMVAAEWRPERERP